MLATPFQMLKKERPGTEKESPRWSGEQHNTRWWWCDRGGAIVHSWLYESCFPHALFTPLAFNVFMRSKRQKTLRPLLLTTAGVCQLYINPFCNSLFKTKTSHKWNYKHIQPLTYNIMLTPNGIQSKVHCQFQLNSWTISTDRLHHSW